MRAARAATHRAGPTGVRGRGAAPVNTESPSATGGAAAVNSGSPMVRLPPADGVGTIQLLVQDDARQLVREREAGEAPDALGLVQHRRRQRCGAAQGERHVPSLQLPAGRPVRQLTRRALLPLFRQRDEARALGNRLEDSRLVLQFPLFHLRIAPQPLEIPVTCRPERRVPHAAHRDDVITHQAYIPRSRCIAATRSIAIMYDAIRVFTAWRSAQLTTSVNERTIMLSSRRLTVSSSQK